MLNLNKNIIQETLGCALMDVRAAEKVVALDISDLESNRDKAVLAAMKSLTDKGKPINLVTMNTELKDEHTEYLIECLNLVSSTVFVDHYIKDIKEASKRRKIRAAAIELYNAAQDGDKSLDVLTAEFTARIDGIADIGGGTISAKEAVIAFVDGIFRKDEAKGVVGIPLLDQSLGSLTGGRLYVVGARPATGKTALAISAAFNTCAYGTVLFCSYEMQPSEIMGRILARLSKVDSQDISYKTLTGAQMQKLAEQYNKAGSLGIRFGINCDTPEKVRAEALRIKDLRLVVIDYLQLMSSGKRSESRRVEVGQISRALKKLSIELNVPVLALSQLNRNSEGSSRPPTMSEMRESGDIEQDADAIVLMYQLPDRDDYFVQTCEESGLKPVRLLLDKNRQGKSGIAIDTAFDGSTMTFISKSAVMEAGL